MNLRKVIGFSSVGIGAISVLSSIGTITGAVISEGSVEAKSIFGILLIVLGVLVLFIERREREVGLRGQSLERKSLIRRLGSTT